MSNDIEAYEKDLEMCNELITKNPNDVDAHYDKANILYDLGKDIEALEEFELVLNLSPDYAKAYYYKGITLMRLNRNEEASEALEKSSNLNPEDSDAICYKGYALYRMQKYEDALVCFNIAIDLNPSNADYIFKRANLLRDILSVEAAIKDYDRTIEIDKMYIFAYNNKGLMFHNLERYDEALELYNKIIDIDPSYVNAFYNKGNTLFRLGLMEEAIQIYDKAIELDPYINEAYANKGLALRSLNRIQEALNNYDKAIDINPDKPEPYYNKAHSLEDLNRLQEALVSYNRALELNPHYCLALISKSLLLLNEFPSDENKLEAFNLLKKTKESYESNLDPNMFTYNEGNIEMIENSLEKIIELEKEIQSLQHVLSNITDKDAAIEIQNKLKSIIHKKKSIKIDNSEDNNAKILENLLKEINEMKKQVKALVEFKENFSSETLNFEKLKKQLHELGKTNPDIKSFVKGFISEFSLAFLSAQVVRNGQVKIEVETCTIISLLSKGLSFIPLLGDTLSSITDYANEYISTVKLTNSCANLSQFGVNSTIADEYAMMIVGYAAVENPNYINNYEKSTGNGFLNSIFKLAEKAKDLKADLDDYIKKNYSRDMPKHEAFGHEVAQDILKIIYDGEIFNEMENNRIKYLNCCLVENIKKNQKKNLSAKDNKSQENSENNLNKQKMKDDKTSTGCACSIF